ncbi:MAG: multidrug ABC transporter [Gammaproteobacteria bacterium]|nr:MAG: multidrug ABC transporter [Gammaproteobacteria bacterium]
MYQRFLENHVLSTLAFLVVLIGGAWAYGQLPRQQDPTINFNWIQITTVFPGASAEDVEKRVTEPLEDALRRVDDIRFVNSTSAPGLSTILVRFEDIDTRLFDKRVAELRREVQNARRELPEEVVDDPYVLEITSANGFPTAQVVVSGVARDENLRAQARRVRDGLERLDGVSQVYAYGFTEPELHVVLEPERLAAAGLTATAVVDALRLGYRDVAAGRIGVGEDTWLVRLPGADDDPETLARHPLITRAGTIELGQVARVFRSHERPDRLVSHEGRPAVLLSVIKTADTNTLELIERINAYIAERRALRASTGVEVALLDDQTEVTRNALEVMQTNALLGLILVLLIAWAFLGLPMALLTAAGIPFILCATFWLLYAAGETLNVVVLLGVVIALGMLVDDAVVVVEAVYHRLHRGENTIQACVGAVREVFAPITSAVLTTMAAFLPLMIMPGIVGDFMFYVPFVVCTALAVSLIEAYWMLPSHIIAFDVRLDPRSPLQRLRTRALRRIRQVYTRLLVRALRHPRRVLAAAFGGFAFALLAAFAGWLNFDFFASDPLRLFYINVKMPAGTPLEKTLEKTVEIENRVRPLFREGELRAIVSYSGLMFTETEPLMGDRYGQVMISLAPRENGLREVGEVIAALRPVVENHPGVEEASILRLAGGPPVMRPISIKVRGDDFAEIQAAVAELKRIMAAVPGVRDIATDDSPGEPELRLRPRAAALQAAGLSQADALRLARLYVDGEIAGFLQSQGEELAIRAFVDRPEIGPDRLYDLEPLLAAAVPLPGGGVMPFAELFDIETTRGRGRIRHYNFRRTVEVSADIDPTQTDQVKANAAILDAWRREAALRHPGVELDTSGVLDDIFESLNALAALLAFGVLVMYLILGTQFRSYGQPLLILATVPLAFTGVALGLLVNRNPVSLWTLYGVVALTGIAVNAAIVLISAANERHDAGMSVLHAIVWAARRRVVPILITSLTTIAGLLSLALGLGGYSLLWGPMASAIVWGLAFSTVLTLFVIPALYACTQRRRRRRRAGVRY